MRKTPMPPGEGKKYVGIDKDTYGGMTPTGNIVKDAWLFGIIPETETCENWAVGQIQNLYDKVYDAWVQHGHLVSKLPDELKQRHQRIHDAAVKRARELGWNPELSDND